MSQATRLTSSRIAVKFDAAIEIERWLLERLQQLPEKRREEWLRALLIQGFRKECRDHRKLNRAAGPGRQPTVGADRLGRRTEAARPDAPRQPGAEYELNAANGSPAVSAAIVSMASLRAVIGHTREPLRANTRTGECA